jgi:hypothetical protein
MSNLLLQRKRAPSKGSRGLAYRLNRWAHLVRCIGWVRETMFPKTGCTLDLVAGFLLKLGRVWVSRGTAFAISWCKEGRESLLYALAHPESEEADRAKRRLRRVY